MERQAQLQWEKAVSSVKFPPESSPSELAASKCRRL